MSWKVGDAVRIRQTEICGRIRSISPNGTLGVDWDDGEITPDGTIHPLDAVGIDDTEEA